MSGMFESKIFTLLHKTLDFRTQRQDLLTSNICLLYTSPSPRDLSTSRMPSSA